MQLYNINVSFEAQQNKYTCDSLLPKNLRYCTEAIYVLPLDPEGKQSPELEFYCPLDFRSNSTP